MNLKELMAARKELTGTMTKLVSEQRSGETMNKENKATFDAAAAKIKDIDADIKRLEELRSLEEVAAVEAPKDNDDFSEFRSFIQGKEVRSQTVGTNSQGGYTVGAKVQNKLIENIVTTGGIVASAQGLTTSNGAEISFPTLDDSDNEAVITSETDARRTGPDLEFGSISLKAFTYDSGIIKISNELVQDASVNIEQIVINALSKRINRKLEKDFSIGNGTTAPSGITTQSILGITAAATEAVTPDELSDMTFSIDKEYKKNASWLMNSNTLKEITKLKNTNDEYVYKDEIKKGTLEGYPIVINETVPDMETGAKPILFGDLNQYLVRNVQGLNVFRFNELYQETNEIGFKASGRFDGTLLNPNACKHMLMA